MIVAMNVITITPNHDIHINPIFVFDFDSVVFWGFTRTEEEDFLDFICSEERVDVLRGSSTEEEFEESEDDMAFTLLHTDNRDGGGGKIRRTIGRTGIETGR